MEQVNNPFQACSDIFVKPNRVFATLAHKHNWSWIPFILVVLMATIPTYLYFNFVDFEWYKELIVQAQAGDKSPAEQSSLSAQLKQGQMQIISVFSIGLGLIGFNALMAIYLNVMGKMDEDNLHGFTDWYGFLWWVSLPVVLSGLISLIMLALSDNHQLSPAELSPTNLSYALGLDMNSKWFSLASSLRLESIWSIYLTAVGISQWTRLSTSKCWLIAVIPSMLIWAIWAVITML